MHRTLFYELTEPQDQEDRQDGGQDFQKAMKTSPVQSPFPETYLVVRFARKLHPKTLKWFVGKIRGSRAAGGGELLVSRQYTQSGTKGVTIHVSASTLKILEVAECLELRKNDRSGLLREFTLSQLDEFLEEGMSPDDLFTTAEKMTVVMHELENIRVLPGEHNLPEYPGLSIYEGMSIFQILSGEQLIEKCYPLHDLEALKKLGRKWYLTLYKRQPYEEIRLYFGENVALYFIFLGFYTLALLPPAALGLFELFIPQTTTVFFCVFNVLWVTLFLEIWKRKSNELAFQWGTLGMTSLDEPRPEFCGMMGVDPVTGRYQAQYPRWKTNAKMYGVSIPIVVICLMVAFVIMLLSFWCEALVTENRREAGDDTFLASFLIMTPTVCYTGLVYIMNFYYRKLATFLTEWENHRTQSQFDRHRVTKLVMFEFINNFMAMFYIAFVIQDMDMLRWQLSIMLIVLQFINNVQEALLPLLIRCYGKKISNFFKSSYTRLSNADIPWKQDEFNQTADKWLNDVPLLDEDDPRVEQAVSEARRDAYEGTYDDYLEMFIQFGYVFLFSSVYPMAAVWAVVNNVIEIRGDAFKLCRVCQRPMPRRVKDIGAWQRAFEALGAMSVFTNCGLLCISPQLRGMSPDTNTADWVLLFVLLEHILLGARYILNITISDKPEWVRVALAKINYQSKQALKEQRMVHNRRHLSSDKWTKYRLEQPS